MTTTFAPTYVAEAAVERAGTAGHDLTLTCTAAAEVVPGERKDKP